MNKADAHKRICADLSALYERKNHDYGDSFGAFFAEFGLISTCMRLTDKLNRLKSFAKGQQMQVKDESVRDTLMDLANYAVMTLVEMDAAKADGGSARAQSCSTCLHRFVNADQFPCDHCRSTGEYWEPKTKIVPPHCPTCKHQPLPIIDYPCSQCVWGDGSGDAISYWEPKAENTEES